MSKYRFVEVHDLIQWDKFAEKAKGYNIFFNSQYLTSIGKKFALFFIYKGEQIKCGVSLLLSDDESSCESDDLIIYNGILFQENQEQKEVRVKAERFELTEVVIKKLIERYNRIEIVLPPEFEDMRPFLWHNYHSTNINGKFFIELLYTSYLNISEFFLKKNNSDNLIYRKLDNVRQSDLKKAENSGLKFKESFDTSIFIKYYKRIFLEQNIDVYQPKLTRIKSLIEQLLKKDLAKIYVTVNNEGIITYLTIFTMYLNKGCYLFGAGNKDAMKRYDGTYCIWNALKKLSNYGIYEVDLEGVNSPKRGSFKLSFGGNLRVYYKVIYDKN